MGRIQHAAMNSVLHLAGLDDRIHSKQIDPEIFACHRMDAINIAFGVFEENAAAPGSLHFENGRSRCRNIRRGNGRCRCTGGKGAASEELTPTYIFIFISHDISLP